MPAEIISTTEHMKEISKGFAGLRYAAGTLKPWYSKAKRIFFDCSKTETKETCLNKIVERQDFDEFIIVSIVKEAESGGKPIFSIEESRFKRLGRENIDGFITRYTKNLREPVALSMQLFNKQQVALLGFTYVSPEEKAQLLEELTGRGKHKK